MRLSPVNIICIDNLHHITAAEKITAFHTVAETSLLFSQIVFFGPLKKNYLSSRLGFHEEIAHADKGLLFARNTFPEFCANTRYSA